MSRVRCRKCLHCGELFRPDARNRRHQRYCCAPRCRQASKAASQRRWLDKPENRDYFRGPEQVRRVQRWRQAHPGYWRVQRSLTPEPLQDHCIVQTVDSTEKTTTLTGSALQDHLIQQPFVLIGLIANLTGSTLQDDIVRSSRHLEQLGRDIVNSGETDDSSPTVP